MNTIFRKSRDDFRENFEKYYDDFSEKLQLFFKNITEFFAAKKYRYF